MNKRVGMICVLFSICFVFAATASAKTKTIALNKTNVTVKNGSTLKLKLKNASAKKVKWSSTDSWIAAVSKNGTIKGKHVGNTTVTAKYKGKKYKCKVRISYEIDADKIDIVYNNDVFTEELYKQIKEIDGDASCASLGRLKDPAAIKLLYSQLAALKLTLRQSQNVEQSEYYGGGGGCNLVLKSGRVVEVYWYRDYFRVDDTVYDMPDMTGFTAYPDIIVNNKE